MKAHTLLTLSAIFATLIFSCSKNNDPAPSRSEKMSATDMTRADTDTTGFAGAAACYATYFGAVQNKSSGYVPGSAEIDLSNCLEVGIIGSGHSIKTYPPAPPVVLTPEPPSDPSIPTTPPPVDDNLAFLQFFSVEGYGFFLYPRTLDEATQLFDRYSQIVCAAIAENISFPNPTYIDKAAASVIYAANHPEVFQSAEDKEMFLQFLGLVFAKPTFVITRGGGRPDTGGILYLSSSQCVNLRLRLPGFPHL